MLTVFIVVAPIGVAALVAAITFAALRRSVLATASIITGVVCLSLAGGAVAIGRARYQTG